MSTDNPLDKKTYDESLKYLKAALEHMVAAGRNVRDFTEFTLERFGDTFLPYLKRFLDELSKGEIRVKGLTKSVRAKFFGLNLTAETREILIREAAYLRAEQRGFAGGSPEGDWLAAEHEVDEWLAHQIGLIDKGRQALASVTSVIEKDLDDIKAVVSEWLKNRDATAAEPKKSVKKSPVKKASKIKEDVS